MLATKLFVTNNHLAEKGIRDKQQMKMIIENLNYQPRASVVLKHKYLFTKIVD